MIYHCIRFTLKPGVSDEEKHASSVPISAVNSTTAP